MQKIIGAKKIGSRELDFFGTSLDLNVGDKVVVEVEEFQTIVEVVETDSKISKPAEDFGKVLRLATDADLSKYDKRQLYDSIPQHLRSNKLLRKIHNYKSCKRC